MEKVDRLGWAEGITIAPFGQSIGLRTNEPAILPRLKSLVEKHSWPVIEEEAVSLLYSLRIGPPAQKGRKNYHLLYLGASQVARSLELDEVLESLEKSLCEIVIFSATEAVFIQGAVVELGPRILVLPALHGTGRRTLLRELEKRGGKVHADSFFALDADGNLQLGEADKRKDPVVCFTAYTTRNKSLRARKISPGESSLYLFSTAVASRSNPALVLGAVSKLATQAISLKGKRGEVAQAADYLVKKLAQ